MKTGQLNISPAYSCLLFANASFPFKISLAILYIFLFVHKPKWKRPKSTMNCSYQQVLSETAYFSTIVHNCLITPQWASLLHWVMCFTFHIWVRPRRSVHKSYHCSEGFPTILKDSKKILTQNNTFKVVLCKTKRNAISSYLDRRHNRKLGIESKNYLFSVSRQCFYPDDKRILKTPLEWQ